jgi:hypothetical protein
MDLLNDISLSCQLLSQINDKAGLSNFSHIYLTVHFNKMWIFYPYKDSPNYDVNRINPETVRTFLATADDSVVAVNTLGFVKSRVSFPLQTSSFFSVSDGIFIRKHVVQGGFELGSNSQEYAVFPMQ